MELLLGAGKLFLHPLFYYLVFFAGLMGVARVKRERQNFHTRVEDAYFELRQLFPLGLIIGLVVSIVSVTAGLVIPMAAILLAAALTLLYSLTANVRLLSPAYTVGIAFFGLVFLAGQDLALPIFNEEFSGLEESIFPSVAVLLGLLVIGEGILVLRNGKRATSPKLIKSKRGLTVGIHESRRLWMLPVFLVIPGEALTAPFEWWPVFTVGGEAYSLLLAPFAVGFHQKVQGMLPEEAISLQGTRVIWLGVLTAAIAAAGYWYPLAAIGAAALAIIGREAITLAQKIREDNLPFFFSKKNNGLFILGVLPGTPADKMGLKVGELITKVNGIAVQEERAFYSALQRNGAHCKLEVIDTNGQIRFVQRALYEGDHHELGILFVEGGKKWGDQAV